MTVCVIFSLCMYLVLACLSVLLLHVFTWKAGGGCKWLHEAFSLHRRGSAGERSLAGGEKPRATLSTSSQELQGCWLVLLTRYYHIRLCARYVDPPHIIFIMMLLGYFSHMVEYLFYFLQLIYFHLLVWLEMLSIHCYWEMLIGCQAAPILVTMPIRGKCVYSWFVDDTSS